jgi:hypothetical protein
MERSHSSFDPALEVLQHPGVAFDSAERARPALLLDGEGAEGSLPAEEILLRAGGGFGLWHGGLRAWA